MLGITFASLFGFPENAYATCVNYIESQTIAAAYEGDEEPTVHTMNTCSGDDISYQIPIATTITFDGVEYSNIYATTNSIITFGNPDNTYWAYPNTPSISLYSMDWYAGIGAATEGLDISYSEGGFQINLQVIPFGQWGAEVSNINILVAITNTGSISVAYSYQGPEYEGMRTGVRLHDGSIVSLEDWGATQIQPGDTIPTLEPEPISESEPLTPEQQQAEVLEAQQLANEISDLNNLIASINNEEIVEPEPIPSPIPSEEAEETPEVIVVEPEIITPEDPRFPDGTDEQSEQGPSTNPEDSETVEEPSENEELVTEPELPSEDTDQSQVDEQENSEPSEDPVQNTDNNPSNNSSTAISDEELKELNKLISENDIKLLSQLVKTNEAVAQAVEEFAEREKENADASMPYTIADAITEVQTERLLEDPIGTFTSMFTEIDAEVFLSPSEWGKDMTDDQKEKVQEIVVSVIIASNLISASMTRRTK